MFGSQVLEVVIGLILIYLILSVGCSGIKEAIAAFFALRAKTLEDAVRKMLNNGGTDIAAQLFDHPLIKGTAPEGEKPSYISSRMFAAALLDVVAPADPAKPRTIDSLRAGVLQLPDAKLRKTLLNIVDNAGNDVDLAREKVAHWFDDTMARVSGWYKRKAQQIIFVAGLVLCFAVNADTIMIVKELWSDEALRNAAVELAKKRAQPPASTQPQTTTGSDDQKAAMQALEDIRSFTSPPIGWAGKPGERRGVPNDIKHGALKVLGLLISSVAILMGASFWFEMLNKVVNLRISGNPPKPE